MADVSVKKDKKGNSYYVSHKRCGFTEGVFLTIDELCDLRELLDGLVSSH